MNLHLKYRPKTLEKMYGNKEVIATLQNVLADADPPHSYLIHGPTGCGKTTLARIIAGMVGCVGGDYQEVDSADYRGIDTTRSIRRQSMFEPLEGPCRVWTIDEAHKLTNDAQNAMLKALEDTPTHVYYILCTTEPQKLISTIRGRCSQYQVHPLSDSEMRHLLRHVVKKEGDSLKKRIYNQIVMDSFGHPRNALQILAQVLATSLESRLETAKQAAELQSETVELCRALIQGAPWKKVAHTLGGLRKEEPESIRRAVLGYCTTILLKGENNRAAAIVEEFAENFYDSGWSKLVYACYAVVVGEG